VQVQQAQMELIQLLLVLRQLGVAVGVFIIQFFLLLVALVQGQMQPMMPLTVLERLETKLT
jgi:hypothetical protein